MHKLFRWNWVHGVVSHVIFIRAGYDLHCEYVSQVTCSCHTHLFLQVYYFSSWFYMKRQSDRIYVLLHDSNFSILLLQTEWSDLTDKWNYEAYLIRGPQQSECDFKHFFESVNRYLTMSCIFSFDTRVSEPQFSVTINKNVYMIWWY